MFSEKYIRVQNLQNSNNSDACIESCIIRAQNLLQLVKTTKLNLEDRINEYCLTSRAGTHKLSTRRLFKVKSANRKDQ